MKKRLLLSLSLMLVLVCFLAICVSAKTVVSSGNKDSQGDIVADLICETQEDKHLCSVDISYTSIDGEEKTSKIYYAVSFWTNDRMRQLDAIYLPCDFDLTQTIYFFDKVDIDGDGVFAETELIKGTNGSSFKIFTYESFENNEIQGVTDVNQRVQAVSYSKYQNYFGSNTFSKFADLKSVTYNGRELEEYICVIASSITRVMSGAFGGDGGSNSNSITSDFTTVIFEDREGTLSLGQYCFTRGIVSEFYFGDGTYTMHGRESIAFHYVQDNSSEYSIERIILSADTRLASGNISWNVGTYDVIVLGTEADLFGSYEANCKSALPNAGSVIYDPCYFGHTEPQDDGDCTTAVVCAACGEYEYRAAVSHSEGEAVEYSDFFEAGVYSVGCTNEGCNFKDKTDLAPMFVSLGYSCTTFGDMSSVAQGYIINKEAIEKYMSLNPDFELGFVAVGNVSGELFTPSLEGTGVVNAKVGLDNDYINIRVSGIGDANKDKNIVFCLYVKTQKKILFLDGGHSSESVVGVKFNDIKATE